MGTSFHGGLLLITDRGQAVRPLVDLASAALTAGFAGVMLREKDLDGRPLLDLAEPLFALCRSAGRTFLVNDRLDVALSLPGAGAHVGAAGIPVPDARRLLGPERLLGYSAHAIDEAERALAAGADYVTVSPIYPSESKPELVPRGVEFLREAVQRLPRRRVVALGGIETPERVRAVRAAGAAGAAVMGAVMRAAAPAAVCRELAAAWEEGG